MLQKITFWELSHCSVPQFYPGLTGIQLCITQEEGCKDGKDSPPNQERKPWTRLSKSSPSPPQGQHLPPIRHLHVHRVGSGAVSKFSSQADEGSCCCSGVKQQMLLYLICIRGTGFFRHLREITHALSLYIEIYIYT